MCHVFQFLFCIIVNMRRFVSFSCYVIRQITNKIKIDLKRDDLCPL